MEICPFCRSNKNSWIITVKKWTIVNCQNCNLVFTRLPKRYVVEKFNRSYYSDDYLSNYEDRKYKFERRFLKRLGEIETIKKGGNLLDVGCSTGLFLRTVDKYSKHKWNLFGIDINKNSIKFAKTKIHAEFYCTSLHKKRFKGNFFDCVTCFDVLEHDADIKGNLEEIYRILKPRGLLVIQAPNYRSVMAFLCGKNWDWWSVPDHVLHFSPPVLSKILSDNGFIVKRLFTWEPAKEFVENIRGTIKKRVTAFVGLNRILSKLSVFPLYFLWFVLRLIEKEFDVGGLLVVYAVKKQKR